MTKKLIGKVKNGEFYLENNKLFVCGSNKMGCLGAGQYEICYGFELTNINPNEIKSISEFDENTTIISMNDDTQYISGQYVQSSTFMKYDLEFLNKLNALTEQFSQEKLNKRSITQRIKEKQAKSNIEVFRQITSDNNLLVVIYDNIKKSLLIV